MFKFLALILNTYAIATPLCHQMSLVGLIEIKDRQIYLITHINSQEEKKWKISPQNENTKSLLYVLENQIIQLHGEKKGQIIEADAVESDPLFIRLSRTKNAIKWNCK